VVLASDDDLAAAVEHARLAGWKARNESRAPGSCFVLLFFSAAFWVVPCGAVC
jgi:hypothetical protein